MEVAQRLGGGRRDKDLDLFRAVYGVRVLPKIGLMDRVLRAIMSVFQALIMILGTSGTSLNG